MGHEHQGMQGEMEGFVKSNAREVRGWVLAVGFKKWPPRAAERAGHPPETCFGAYFRALLLFLLMSLQKCSLNGRD